MPIIRQSGIIRDLIEILKRIPRMDEPDVRDDLLWGLSFEERETIKPRYPEDMLADLKSLVGGLERLGKLATLIENAKDRPKPPELDRELDRISIKLINKQKQNLKICVSHSAPHGEADRSFHLPYEFDVFLAHHSQDKPQVETIAEELKRRSLNPWLDKEQIPPGRWFQDIIQQAISNVKSAAIFIGSKGFGKWQIVELRAFISQCVEADLPVIPVLLPGVNDVPESLLFLKELNWVRFSNRIDDVEALDNLEWGITGKHPQRDLR